MASKMYIVQYNPTGAEWRDCERLGDPDNELGSAEQMGLANKVIEAAAAAQAKTHQDCPVRVLACSVIWQRDKTEGE